MFRLSARAESDLSSIAQYTVDRWGIDQAVRYLDQLEHSIRLIADNPALGRSCDWIRPGLHRYEVERHVVFYRILGEGIFVSRILHQNMLPKRHRMDDE